ncbi:MAG: hypothetical protein JSU86_03520 [Phycisphaerales bacterium]|nr:MAG: hypothetical protein JSU86_03520 [Phycisphaerales bacterium]
MNRKTHPVVRTMLIPLIILVGVAAADDFEMSRSTIDGGGATRTTGGEFGLFGTIGQPDAGILSGGDFVLSGGFWFGVPPDDCNSNGWVDLVDYDEFEECLSGPDGGLVLPECNCFDLDGDNDIDLLDVHKFQGAFTGE